MKKCFKRAISYALAVLMFVCALPVVNVSAKYNVEVKGHTVVDRMVFNGVTIEAVYTNYFSGYDGDTTYCCAALVKRFYQQVYGVNVWNLISNQSPAVSKGSFSATSNPQVGDVVRRNSKGHWMIVKAVNGNTITLFEQNFWSSPYKYAPVDRTISKTDSDYMFFRWSEATGGGSSSNFLTCIDNGISEGATYDLSRTQQIHVSGWAFRSSNELTRVYYQIDNGAYLQLPSQNRQDVVDVYSNTQLDCGFDGYIDITLLSIGTHRIRIWCSSNGVDQDMAIANINITNASNVNYHDLSISNISTKDATITTWISVRLVPEQSLRG